MNEEKKKILIFDDRIPLIEKIEAILTEENFDPIICDRIATANRQWESHHDTVSLMVVDLNMPHAGLKQEEKVLTQDGLRTGWIWLENYVFSGPYKKENFESRVIIFSDYLTELEEYLSGRDTSMKRYDKMTKISKRDRKSTEKIIETIKKMTRKK